MGVIMLRDPVSNVVLFNLKEVYGAVYGLFQVLCTSMHSSERLMFCCAGRVARAGRSGRAFSLVCPDEVPFVYDLHLFLGRPLHLATIDHQQGISSL